MFHVEIIKDGDVTKVQKEILVDGQMYVDETPREGSANLVTSDGVNKAIGDTKESVDEDVQDLQEQIDDIAEKAGSGYTPKGEASVATLNGLSGQENGELYILTDAGTLTDGSLAVVAGDTVAWDATNSVWYKAMDYAPRQYGTNEVHNLPTTITAFRTGDVIPVDGPSGTAKMSKDDLLRVTAQNALGSIHLLSDTATEADLVAENFLAIDVPGVGGATKKVPGNLVASASKQDRQLDLIETLQINCYNYVKWELGNISSGDGKETDNVTRCRTPYIRIDDILSLKRDSTAVAAARYLCFYYAEDFSYISYLNDITTWVKGTTSIPVKAYYVRFVDKYYTLPTDVYTHSVFVLDTAFEKISVHTREIEKLNADMYGASLSVTWEDGSIVSGTGVDEASTTRCRTGKIKIYDLDKIETFDGRFMLCFYGEDNIYYSNDFKNNLRKWDASTYTGDAVYVRVVDKSHTSDDGANEYVTITQKSGLESVTNKTRWIADFSNKKFTADGDSITAGDNWGFVTYDLLHFESFTNIGVGSSSWADRKYTLEGTTYTPQENVTDPSFAGFSSSTSHSVETIQAEVNNCSRIHLLKYIADIAAGTYSAPDVFVFAFGTNDVSSAYNNTLGDADEALATGKNYPTGDILYTLAGAMKWTLQKALDEFPNCKFYVSLPIHSGDAARNASNLLKIAVIKKIAEAFSVPVIDQYNNCGITWFFENDHAEGRYLRDGLHPKDNGKKLMGTYAAEQIVTNWSGQV